MTEFDPYSILGLGRSAKQAAIKTAYRERVRHSHPDRGGNSDDFIAIVKAFGLLSDPETRRKAYKNGASFYYCGSTTHLAVIYAIRYF